MCGDHGYQCYIMRNLLGQIIDPRWLDLCYKCDHMMRRELDKDTYEQALNWMRQ